MARGPCGLWCSVVWVRAVDWVNWWGLLRILQCYLFRQHCCLLGLGVHPHVDVGRALSEQVQSSWGMILVSGLHCDVGVLGHLGAQ